MQTAGAVDRSGGGSGPFPFTPTYASQCIAQKINIQTDESPYQRYKFLHHKRENTEYISHV